MKYVIFGAGKNGKELLSHLGADQVVFFCDNNEKLVGTQISGIKVISPKKLMEISSEYTIIISPDEKSFVRRQLEKIGIYDYVIYVGDEKKKLLDLSEQENRINRTNNALKYYIEESRKIDPIFNYQSFKKLVNECKNDSVFDEWIDNYGRTTEALRYGHFRALSDYAEIEDCDSKLFPIIAHGVFFFGPQHDFDTATIYASPYYKKELNKRYPYIPSFSVGPYIKYVKARNICVDKRDTVLVYMEHSVECEDIEYSVKYLNNKLFDGLREKYKKIILCVYWYDIDKEIYQQLWEQGITIVSAGFRFDEEFIVRTKQILDLSDDVVVCGPTSAMIYALCLGKRLTYYDSIEDSRKVTDLYDAYYYVGDEYASINNKWINVLVRNRGKKYVEYVEEDKNIIDELFGINIKRTPEEIRLIYRICTDIWYNCEFDITQYPLGVYKTFWNYQMNYEFEKLTTLSNSLGTGFWNI